MKRKDILCLIGALLLMSSSLVQAQTVDDALTYTQRTPGASPFMVGLSGAGIGGIANWGAVLANPAGLGYIGQSQVQGGLSMLSALDEATYTVGDYSQFQEARESSTRLSDAAYIYRFPTVRGSMVAAIGYNRTHAFDRTLSYQGVNHLNSITDYFMPLPGEFEIERLAGEDGIPGTADDEFDITFFRPISYIAFQTYAIDFDRRLYDSGERVPFVPAVLRLPVSQSGKVFEEGGSGELNIAGAVEAAQDVMVGLSANISFSNYGFQRVFEEVDDRQLNDGSDGTIDFDFLRFVQHLDAELTGINLRGGLSTRVTPFLRLGFVLETPTVYDVKENYSTRLETGFDNGDFFTYGGQPGDEGTGAFEYRIATPWRMGVGGVIRTGSVYLALDAERVDWTQMRMRSDTDQTYFDDLNLEIRETLQPVWNVRLGAEFKKGPVAVRGGIATYPDARKQSEVDRTRQFVSAGLSYHLSAAFWLDIGWQQESFDDIYRPYTEVDQAPQVAEKVTRNRFMLGIRVMMK